MLYSWVLYLALKILWHLLRPYRVLPVLPQGSKDANNSVFGTILMVFWALKTYWLGPWTLRARSLGRNASIPAMLPSAHVQKSQS